MVVVVVVMGMAAILARSSYPHFHRQPEVIRGRGVAETRVLTAAAAALSEERSASASAGQTLQV